MTRLFIAGLLAMLAFPASAQMQCYPHDQYVAAIAGGKWKEQRLAMMMVSNGMGVLSFYGNHETGTWTLVLRTPQGLACPTMTGEGFEFLKPEPREPGEDS